MKRTTKRAGRISARTGKPVVPEKKLGPEWVDKRSAEFFSQLKHQRQSKRTKVTVEASLKIMLKDGSVYDTGTCTVLNVSPSGALLGKMKLPKNSFPAQPFTLELVMKGGDFDGMGVEALPVRFEHEHGGIGVKFLEIFVAV
ncbi:MAG TPA: PilZ domain-containing protein [Planctomycetota bacterium]|nr:PilZ domain-containing protein [Planctomycetota bacterium]